MIHTSRQLKALVRNMSKGDSSKAQIIIRSYVMERFLERLSLSQYQSRFILKGGLLVTSMIGLENRSTMDVDATLKNLPLNEEDARKIISEIATIQIDDGMMFELKSVAPIMDDADYPGIRIIIDAMLEDMRTPLKIDLSTGDVITPHEVSYSYKMMFENRTIPLIAYNLETILAEKLETVIARGTANSRMRDYYDIYIITDTSEQIINYTILKDAVANTSLKRGSDSLIKQFETILDEVSESKVMVELWQKYRLRYDYAANIIWDDVIQSVKQLAYNCIDVSKS